jgi:hypothetical protein
MPLLAFACRLQCIEPYRGQLALHWVSWGDLVGDANLSNSLAEVLC